MFRRDWVIWLTSLLLPLLALAQPSVSYRNGTLQLYPATAAASFSVYRGEWSATDWGAATAILGRRSERGDTLTFRPLVAFTPGQTYTVRYAGKPPLLFRLPLPADYDSPRVIGHYPTAQTVPSNLLKIHLRFSRPMGSGSVYDHLHLIGSAGDTISRAILPLEPPLWNRERTVLTLWLEPGRIKRELGPNQRLGPILSTGRQYSLKVAPGLRDAQGQPLAAAYSFYFAVGARDTLRPNPARWQLRPAIAGSRRPLTIECRETLDWATAIHYLRVNYSDGTEVAGQWALAAEDQALTFQPDAPWRADQYTLRVDPRLEDLAGNNVRRLFDRPPGTADSAQNVPINLSFRVQ